MGIDRPGGDMEWWFMGEIGTYAVFRLMECNEN